VSPSTRVLALHNLASDSELKHPAQYDDIVEDVVAFVEGLLKVWRLEQEAEAEAEADTQTGLGATVTAGREGSELVGSGSGTVSGGKGGSAPMDSESKAAAQESLSPDLAGSEGAGAEVGRKRSRWETGVAGGGSAAAGAATLVGWKAPRATWPRRLPPFAWDDAAAHAWDEKCRLGEPDADTMGVFGGKSVVQSVSGERFLMAVDRVRGPRMQVAGLGSVFLELDSVATAVRLQQELSGRVFGDRIVLTSYLSEVDYAEGWFWGWGR